MREEAGLTLAQREWTVYVAGFTIHESNNNNYNVILVQHSLAPSPCV